MNLISHRVSLVAEGSSSMFFSYPTLGLADLSWSPDGREIAAGVPRSGRQQLRT